jgi:hypothetical protein
MTTTEGSENIVSGLEYGLLKMYSAPSAKQIQTNMNIIMYVLSST